MGGCANSKYAVDEDKQTKKDKKPINKDKKNKNKKGEVVDPVVADAKPEDTPAVVEEKVAVASEDDVKTEAVVQNAPPKAEKEEIEFIDSEKQAHAAAAEQSADSDAKKEVTTYQTTVVKHTQKEGDELMQHLKDEAFRTLQTSLKQINSSQHRTQTTTATSSANQTPETAHESSDDSEDLLQQIKNQVLSSLGKTNEAEINSILDAGASLIKDNKVKNMKELEDQLEKLNPNSTELVKKIINSTTGFLTAKGTEAGVILSNILANANSGLQGIMNETEKTTVKVTRTVTEQVLSGGQLKEITRIITSNEPVGANPPANIQEILKNIASDSKVTKTGTTVTSANTVVSETHEHLNNEESSAPAVSTQEDLVNRAEKVVTKVVSAAVEKIMDENHADHNGTNGTHVDSLTNGFHKHENGVNDDLVEENIKIEDESTIKISTTKIVLNGDSLNNGIEQAQAEFFKNGKQAAEDFVKKVVVNSSEIVVNNNSTELNGTETN